MRVVKEEPIRLRGAVIDRRAPNFASIPSVRIICKGLTTTATETMPGVFRCDSCGDRVRVVIPAPVRQTA